jgi:predicted FMN-binding regulatory protein PaiB
MSQNRTLPDRLGVIDGLDAQGGPSALTAALVAERSRA